MLICEILKLCMISVVPTPELSLNPVNPPTLSELLTLECNATAVRGITSRLDFMWTRSDDDGEVIVRNMIGANTTGNSLVYTDTYTTPMALSESDIGVVYLCEISLNDEQGEILTNSLNVTLDTSISKYMYVHFVCYRFKTVNCIITVPSYKVARAEGSHVTHELHATWFTINKLFRLSYLKHRPRGGGIT